MGDQLGQPHGSVATISTALNAQLDIGRREITNFAEHVMKLIGRSCSATVGQALQLQLDVGEHARIEQFTKFLGTKQGA